MRVLVTGSRKWTDRDAVYRALDGQLEIACAEIGLPGLTVVHGDCAIGADRLADEWVKDRRKSFWQVFLFLAEPHPADWERHGKSAGPIRNQQMVDLGADVCLAFPLGRSPGTRHCMKAAERAGIPVINYAEREQ